MALIKQTANLSFENGIDTKTNPKLVQGKLLELVNAQVNNKQIEKSNGYKRLARSNQIDQNAFKALANFNDNLLVANNDRLSIYDQLSDQLIDRGDFSYVHHDAFTIKTNINAKPTIPQVLTSAYQNYLITIHFDAVSIDLIVFDTVKNIQINKYDLKTIDPQITPLAIAATETGVFLYTLQSGVTNQLYEVFIDYATNQLQTVTLITSTFVWSKISDRSIFCLYNDKKVWLFIKEGVTPASATANIIVRDIYYQTLKIIPNIIATDCSTDSFQKYSFCCTMSLKNNEFIAVANDTLFAYDLNSYIKTRQVAVTGVKTAPFYSCVYVENKNQIILVRSRWYNQLSGSANCTFPFINKFNCDNNIFFVSGETLDPRYDPSMIYNTVLSADMFTNGNRAFFPVQYLALPQTTNSPINIPVQEQRVYNFVLDEDYNIIDTIVNQVGIRQVYTNSSIDYINPSVCAPDFANKIYPISYFVESRLTIQNKDFLFSYQLNSYRFDDDITAPFFAWQRGLAVYMGVGKLFQFSTRRLVEQGFSDYPQVYLSASAGGNLEVDKSYEYAVVYEWINGKGEVFTSSPSILKEIIPTGTNLTVTVHITPPVWFTQKQLAGELQSQNVKIYRTVADGNTLYLISTLNFNQYTIANLTFVDDGTVANIESNEIIYTSGGVLENFPAPSAIVTTLHSNRLFSVPSDNLNTVYYSKPYQIGVGVGYSPFLYFTVEPRGGSITELASLDDKLLIFKRDYIYVVAGDGADATGNNVNLSLPELINSPVGCSEPNSVIRTPDGVMFKSLKGIYILDRSLAVSYIGADVEKYNSETIVSVALLLSENKVKYITAEGSILIYDYYYRSWSTESNLPSVSSAIYNGRFVTLLQSGKIYLQTPDYYKRESSNYSMLVRTGWLHVGKLQDYQRIYEMLFLGDLKGEHVIRVSISYNYVDTIRDYVYFDPKQNLGIKNAYGIGSYGQIIPYGGDFTSLYQFRLKFPRQKVESISLTFEDVFDNIGSETGNSFTISDIQFVFGMKQGNFRIGRSQMSGGNFR